MTSFRRAGLGLLVVLLLAVSATAVGYAMRRPTGPDINGAATVQARPVAENAPVQPVAEPVAEPPMRTHPPRSQKHPIHQMEPGRVLLSKGDTGMKVRDLQARLAQLYWYAGRGTGDYDATTVEAVRGFQHKRQIPVTGDVDQRTLDRLTAMSTTPTTAELHNKTPSPGKLDPRCLTGRVMCIDKTTSTLRWVVGGHVLQTLDARFGSTISNTPTREGLFHVYLKDADHVSQMFGSSMPYSMFFSGGQAVHYSSDFAAVGYNGASHGCVNIRDYDGIRWLFSQVRVGDKVVVYWS
jgi:peptidoglycan hydrolase-like protein with peptidoglycan-binding domain